MHRRILDQLNLRLERWLPEQRLFVKSSEKTRFLRLRPVTQLCALGAIGAMFAWAVVASAILFISGISSGSAREQNAIAQAAFEQRLVALAQERDSRSREAQAAQARFQIALGQVSAMQSKLLASEERRREVETGMDVIQATLKRTVAERDAARRALNAARGEDAGKANSLEARATDMEQTVDMLSARLASAARQRDDAIDDAEAARFDADRIAQEKRLMEARNDEIFTTLEGAVNVSMKPFDTMFRRVGMNPDAILKQIQRGYSGVGGPLMPIAFSSKGGTGYSQDDMRAADMLDRLDQLNMYRLAVEKLPFSVPLQGGYRFTSPFGYRWGRLHAGVDLAGPIGMDVHAPASGVVTKAGWEGGYGQMIEIRHDFGVTTVYGHLSKIRVSVGEKVSRGDVIGDSGNSGRSTGPHLHYEIRVGGAPQNPMTFIKAAQDVF